MAPSCVCCPSATVVSGTIEYVAQVPLAEYDGIIKVLRRRGSISKAELRFALPGVLAVSLRLGPHEARPSRGRFFFRKWACAVSCSGSSGRSAWRCGKAKIGLILPQS